MLEISLGASGRSRQTPSVSAHCQTQLAPLTSEIMGSILTIRTHVKRVSQRSAESRVCFLRVLRFPPTCRES
jgi:hypothetical protein